jgi:hypothetical protein
MAQSPMIQPLPYVSLQGVAQAVEVSDVIKSSDGITIYPADATVKHIELDKATPRKEIPRKGDFMVVGDDGKAQVFTKQQMAILHPKKI